MRFGGKGKEEGTVPAHLWSLPPPSPNYDGKQGNMNKTEIYQEEEEKRANERVIIKSEKKQEQREELTILQSVSLFLISTGSRFDFSCHFKTQQHRNQDIKTSIHDLGSFVLNDANVSLSSGDN